MTSAIHTPTRDLTGQQAPVSTGSDWRLRWACGCKARREPGAVVRGSFLLRCADCERTRRAAVCGGSGQAVGTVNNGANE